MTPQSKPYLCDSHLHSAYSFDGEMPLSQICEQAIHMGLKEITITDHVDLYAHRRFETLIDADRLYADISMIQEQYQGKLIIHAGAELGQPQINPEDATRFLSSYPLDFVIGSIHNLEDDYDIYYYDYTRIDCEAFYHHYLDWVTDLALHYDYDVLGHLTYPLRYMAEAGITLSLAPYMERFESLFRQIIPRGKGIELNASGLFQTMQETMPPLSLLQLYRDCGGTIITLGSDAHHLQHVGLPIPKAAEILRKAGFEQYCTFHNRCPIYHNLDA